jgi:hypothetical protein
MTSRFPALTLLLLLGTVAVAEAQNAEKRMTVFVTAALDGTTTNGTKDDPTSKDLIGSVVDVKNAIKGSGMRGRRKHLELVAAATEAELIVEVRGRRSGGGRGLGRTYVLVFAIKHGAEPERVLEANGNGSWKLAGAVAATMVDEYARDHAKAGGD